MHARLILPDTYTPKEPILGLCRLIVRSHDLVHIAYPQGTYPCSDTTNCHTHPEYHVPGAREGVQRRET